MKYSEYVILNTVYLYTVQLYWLNGGALSQESGAVQILFS